MMQITIKKSQNVYELQEVCFFHSDFTFILILLLYSNLPVHTLPTQFSLTYLLLFQVESSLCLINIHRLGLKASAKPDMLSRTTARITVPSFPKARTWWTARRKRWRTWEWHTSAPAPPAPWYEQHGALLPCSGISHCQTLVRLTDASREFDLSVLINYCLFIFLSRSLCTSRKSEMLRARWCSLTRWSMMAAGPWWRLLCLSRCTRSLPSMNPTGQPSWRQGRHRACP